MTTKHTAGPWRREKLGEMGFRIVYIDELGHGRYIAHGYDEKNAALIEAAPAMAEALRGIAEISAAGVIERRETGKPTWCAMDAIRDAARAALEKAGA